MRYASGKEASLQITALEPGRREELETISAPMNVKPTLTYLLEPEGDGTSFTRAIGGPTDRIHAPD